MVGTIQIIVKKDEITPWAKTFPKKVIDIGERGTWNLTQKGAKFLREAAFAAGPTSYFNKGQARC